LRNLLLSDDFVYAFTRDKLNGNAWIRRIKGATDLGIDHQAHLFELLDDAAARSVLVDDVLQQPVDQV